MGSMIQQIKDHLVSMGPKSPVVRLALKLHGRRNGFKITFPDTKISIQREDRVLILSERDFYLVPITLECFEQTFHEVQPDSVNGLTALDFSAPKAHRYRKHSLTLRFPGIAEDDSIAAYTHWYKPKTGDLVFDVGANAGFTTCMLSRMVGPEGRVIAFEPDRNNLMYLENNLRDQRISNVTTVPGAIDAKTGIAYFNADGTMGAGLVEYSVYGNTGSHVAVETLSLQDACSRFGKPSFIKMDIEGAEINVIEAASDFLKHQSIHLAFDSYHRMRDGRFTWMLLEPMLGAIGYEVDSSSEFGQMFTWARPPKSLNETLLRTE